MVISLPASPWPNNWSDYDAVTRLQTILLQACEGQRGPELDAEYKQLRQALLSNTEFSDLTPGPVRTSRDLAAFWTYIKQHSGQWEPRRVHIRTLMEPLLVRAEDLDGTGTAGANVTPDNPDAPIPSSSWTGVQSPSERARAVRSLVPVALGAIETLIAQYELIGSNGGPPLEERKEALETLRALHSALTDLLAAADAEDGLNERGQGLIVEAAKYASRFARSVREEPIPYAISGLVLALFSAFGPPDIGGWLAGIALQIRRNVGPTK